MGNIKLKKLFLTPTDIEIASNLIKKDEEGKCFCNKDLEGNIIPIEQMASIYIENNICYCIDYEKEKIGLLCLENNNEVAIFIEPNYQNKGIGTKILKEFLNIVRENNGTNSIVAEITLDNIRSIHVFKKLGFKTTYQIREVPISGITTKVEKYILEVNNVNKK